MNDFSTCFDALNAYLKAHFKKLSRKNHPWICLLGASESGKSSLLQYAQCELKSPSQLASDKLLPTQTIDWWINNDAILLDTSGKIFFDPEQTAANQKNWKQLLKLCKKQHGHRPFDHLVFTIDCMMLSQNKLDEKFTQTFIQQILTLKQFYPNCPITIMLTQTDHIDGFNEFFADLTADDRDRGFGFKTKLSTQKNLNEQITQYFNDFAEKLNQQTLPRLHREQNLQKREHIQTFPIQMEKVCALLCKFILQIPVDISTQIQGIYFSSSETKGAVVNFTDHSIADKFHLQHQQEQPSSRTRKSFFIRNVMLDIINNSVCFTQQPRHQLLRWATIPFSVLVILAFTVIWHHAYETNITLVELTKNELSHKDTQLPKSLGWLVELNNMQHIIATYRNSNMNYYHWLGFPQTAKLYANTQKAYQRMLVRFFQNYINQMLTNAIKNNSDNRLQLYYALKTYIMLINPKHYDQATVVNWFDSQWKRLYPNQSTLITQLNAHLIELLNTPKIHWKYDPQLITSAQQQLQQLPLADVAFLELQGQFKLTAMPILSGPNQMPGLNLDKLTIPALYSADNFQHIYLKIIPKTVSNLLQKNWVLGNNNLTSLNQDQIKSLTDQLRDIYIQHYTQHWLETVKQIQFTLPQNLADLQDLIKFITDKSSALNQLLKIIIGNATLAQQTTENNTVTDKSFTAIEDLAQQNNSFVKIKQTLTQLSNYVNNVVAAPDPDKASYNLVIYRLQQQGKNDAIANLLTLAKESPQPIQNWLNTIAQGSWQVLLNQARSYLNTIWATTVLPEYNSHIAKRYPIDKNSDDDITLEDFTHFFGPGGTVDVFFNYYLKPLVNLQKNYWTWITLQNGNIGIPQKTLNMFIRASLIQQMFFTDDRTKPSFSFALSPVMLSNQASSFTLNLEGQILQLTHHNQYNSNFIWPGSDPGSVTIHFAARDNQNPTLTTDGVWAWFRLLDQSQLKSTDTASKFTVDFTLSDYHARFKIIAHSKINPYLPNIISKFSCPDSL